VCAFRRNTLVGPYTTANLKEIQIFVAAGREFYRFRYLAGGGMLFKTREISRLKGGEIYDKFPC